MSTDFKNTEKKDTHKTAWLRPLLQLVLALVVLGCAVVLGKHYLNTPPKAKPKKRSPVAPLVTVTTLTKENIQYSFEAMGTVVPSRQIQLSSQVSGEITAMSEEFIPGGYFSTGEELIAIDPTDYHLTITQLESALAKASSDLDLEMGNQRIALKEFEILGEPVSDTEKQLMLRQPQLETARANMTNARAQLEKAQMDLARTKIRAPFNGVVLSRSVNLGSRVTTSTALGQLAGTDRFWIRVTVPVHQLQWLAIPIRGNEKGSSARIFSQNTNTHFREGEVIRLAPDLEEQGRMAVVYVAVDDPLCLLAPNREQKKLLLGSFVRVRFAGKELQGVTVVQRDHLHEGNSLWLMTEDNRLAIEPVDVIAKTKEYVYIPALKGARKLITSAIASPTPGMLLQTEQNRQGAAKGSKQPSQPPDAVEKRQ